jgi:AAA+ ATPase superfamily predicted ATPase
MEIQIEYFAVFGGLDVEIDTSKPIQKLIKDIILKDFYRYYEKIRKLTSQNRYSKRLLRALAVGDRRIFSAFNKANLNNQNGGEALHYLELQDVIQIEYSREEPARSLQPKGKLKREVARHRISHKVLFKEPFVRFWFYFVSRYVKEIQSGNYENFLKNFQQRQNSYTSLIFEELSEILLNYHLRDSDILSSGSYWDRNVEIDILTITKDEKKYIAECKWRNHKINKKELHKLEKKCKKLDITPNQIILFSKRGFSKELLQMQGSNLALYSCEDFSLLVNTHLNSVF